jgi:hypothetical protein
VVVRYRASGSIEGVEPVVLDTAYPSSQPFINHLTTSCAGGGGTGPVAGRTVNELYTCAAALTGEKLTVGASDVQGSSFGQEGPAGTRREAIDTSSIDSQAVVVLPFKLVLSSNVRLQTTGFPRVPNLQKTQVEALFANSVPTWDLIRVNGFPLVAVDSADSPLPDQTVFLCHRTAGSGTKAALDQIVMTLREENVFDAATSGGTITNAQFNLSSSDMRACVNATTNPGRGAIGYLDGDSAVAGAYNVRYQGYFNSDFNNPACASPCTAASNPTFPGLDLRTPVITGLYDYWTYLRFNRRPENIPAGLITPGGTLGTCPAANSVACAVANELVALAQSVATLNQLPAAQKNNYVALSEMRAFKSADAGPIGF